MSVESDARQVDLCVLFRACRGSPTNGDQTTLLPNSCPTPKKLPPLIGDPLVVGDHSRPWLERGSPSQSAAVRVKSWPVERYLDNSSCNNCVLISLNQMRPTPLCFFSPRVWDELGKTVPGVFKSHLSTCFVTHRTHRPRLRLVSLEGTWDLKWGHHTRTGCRNALSLHTAAGSVRLGREASLWDGGREASQRRHDGG